MIAVHREDFQLSPRSPETNHHQLRAIAERLDDMEGVKERQLAEVLTYASKVSLLNDPQVESQYKNLVIELVTSALEKAVLEKMAQDQGSFTTDGIIDLVRQTEVELNKTGFFSPREVKIAFSLASFHLREHIERKDKMILPLVGQMAFHKVYRDPRVSPQTESDFARHQAERQLLEEQGSLLATYHVPQVQITQKKGSMLIQVEGDDINNEPLAEDVQMFLNSILQVAWKTEGKDQILKKVAERVSEDLDDSDDPDESPEEITAGQSRTRIHRTIH